MLNSIRSRIFTYHCLKIVYWVDWLNWGPGPQKFWFSLPIINFDDYFLVRYLPKCGNESADLALSKEGDNISNMEKCRRRFIHFYCEMVLQNLSCQNDKCTIPRAILKAATPFFHRFCFAEFPPLIFVIHSNSLLQMCLVFPTLFLTRKYCDEWLQTILNPWLNGDR